MGDGMDHSVMTMDLNTSALAVMRCLNGYDLICKIK